MKKKLALLLALSMVLSMVPVSVFGEGRAIYTLTDPANVSDVMGKEYDVIVAIKASAFRRWALEDSIGQTTTPAGIILPQDDKKLSIVGAEVFERSNATFGQVVDGSGNVTAAGDVKNAISREGNVVTVYPWDQIGSNDPLEDLYIQLTIRILDDADEYYVDFVTNNSGSTIISGVTVDSALVAKKAGSWTIKGGDQVFFADIATLNPITIRETVAQQFGYEPKTELVGGVVTPIKNEVQYKDETISLVLPYGFAWMSNNNWTYPNGPASTSNSSNNFYENNVNVSDAQQRFINLSTVATTTTTPNPRISSAIRDAGDNRVLTFTLKRSGEDEYIKTPTYFDIRNLRFVASDDARMGDINIKVFRGGYATTLPVKERDMDEEDDLLEKVANYSNYGLVISEDDEDDMAELISGTYDVETSAFTITELTPNSFPTSRTETLGARFDAPEGVQFTRAHVWFGVSGSSSPIIGTGNKMKDHAVPYEVGEAPDGNGVRLTAGSLYISPPMDRRNTKDVYTMSVYFDVSIVPGFVGPDDDSKDINISFEGTILDTKEIPVYESDKKTAFGKKEVTVATVIDRITVDADKASIDESNAGLYIRDIAVNNIVINETDVGMLELNTELWVFVDSPRSGDITFTAGQPYADTESGLRVSRATKLDIPELPTGIRFTVTRESSGVPGTITIPGGLISGFLYPRVDYEIVVTGDSVAMSHDVVNYYDSDALSLGETLSQYVRDNQALFEKSLYKTALFSYTGNTLLEVPGEPGTGVVTGPGRVKEPATFTSNTPYFSVTEGKSIERPFITIPVPSLENGSGLIAARAFAEMVGIEIQYLGDSKSRMYDPYTGIEVIYSFKPGQDNSVCSVNGVPYTFRNNEGYPVSVYTLNDEWTYLPARTFGDLFGYTVTYLDPTAGGPGILYTPK